MTSAWWRRALQRMTRAAAQSPRKRKAAPPCRPGLELLEDRLTPSTFTVTNLNDTGDGSLRAAIAAADADTDPSSVIAFDPTVTGTINLESALPDLSHNVSVNGPGATVLAVARDPAAAADFTIFTVDTGVAAAISGLTVTGGRAVSGLDSFGGGLVNLGTLTVSDTTFSGNTAGPVGGGAVYNAGSLTATGCTFAANSVTGASAHGGGIENVSTGTLTVTGCLFTGNMATNNASGAGLDNAGTATVSDSTFSGNSAGSDGGAVENSLEGTLTVSSSTFANNSAGSDGGAILDDGTATLSNCTISGNTSASDGSGLDARGGSATLYDTIIAGNSSGTGGDIDGSITSLGHNLIGNGDGASGFGPTDQVGTTAHVIDARLGPLGNYGGPTPTLALLSGSPAIDAGDNTNAPATDQRGFTRVVNGTIDIGAFELQAADTTTVLTAPPSANEGDTVTFTATVTVTSTGDPATSGSVNFVEKGTVLATRSVGPGGVATFDTSGLAVGTHTVTAVYSGDSSFNPSPSQPATVAVNFVNDLTVLSPTVSTNEDTPRTGNVLTGAADTESATITAVSGTFATAQGGSVTIAADGSYTYIPPAGFHGTDSFTFTALTTDDTTVGTVTVNVVSNTTTTLSAAAMSLGDGQSVALTARVVASFGTPAGSVTFKDGDTTLATVALGPDGTATLTTALGPGTHSVTAVYSGSTTFDPSTSSPLSVTVGPPLTGDVTGLVDVTLTPGPHHKGKPATTRTLTVVNNSGLVIEGPLTVVLKGLKPSVRLLHPAGFTGKKRHRRPFVVLAPSGNLFLPGQQLTLLLRFRGKPNHFTTTVSAGPGTP